VSLSGDAGDEEEGQAGVTPEERERQFWRTVLSRGHAVEWITALVVVIGWLLILRLYDPS
jgi:hypothetical protein